MPASLLPPLKFRGYDANGKALAGGKLFTYYSGTNIALATYKDKDKVTLNTNPVVLNAAGEADVWLDLLYVYRLELRDANNVQIYVRDGIVADRTSGTIGPQGPQGDKGDKGDTGNTGLTGGTGAKGDTGDKGDKGDKGDTGATGATGAGIPAGGAEGQLIVKSAGTGVEWSLNMVVSNYGFKTGLGANKLRLQNYYPGVAYLSQNIYRSASTGGWLLDDNAGSGAGIIFQTNSGVDTGKTHILGCSPGYTGDFPAIATWDSVTGFYGINTKTPTQRLDVNGNARIRGTIRDSADTAPTIYKTLSANAAGNLEWQGSKLSVCTVAVPLKNGTAVETTHPMVLTAENTLGATINGSGYWVCPANGVYDIYAEGRPVLDNISGGIYGFGQYTLTTVADVFIAQGEGSFPVNGRIGIWVKLVAFGVTLSAGTILKFKCNHYSGNSVGALEAHSATVRFVLRR